MSWLLEGIHKIKRTVILILLATIIVFLLTRVFRIVHVEGNSMSPTYVNGDYVIVNCLMKPGKGDVAVFDSSLFEKDKVIKRIVAVENDVVEVTDNKLSINGKENKKVKETDSMEPIKVLKNQFFILGDNVNHSYDSRNVGVLSEGEVYGTVVCSFGGFH